MGKNPDHYCRKCGEVIDLIKHGRYCVRCGHDWWDGAATGKSQLNADELKAYKNKIRMRQKIILSLVVLVLTVNVMGGQIYSKEPEFLMAYYTDESYRFVCTGADVRPSSSVCINSYYSNMSLDTLWIVDFVQVGDTTRHELCVHRNPKYMKRMPIRIIQIDTIITKSY